MRRHQPLVTRAREFHKGVESTDFVYILFAFLHPNSFILVDFGYLDLDVSTMLERPVTSEVAGSSPVGPALQWADRLQNRLAHYYFVANAAALLAVKLM